MKKLMMVVAAFALAASAQAATFNWKWTSTLKDPTSTAFSGTVYLFNAQDYSQQTILTAFLANPKSYALSGAIDSYATSNGKNSTGAEIPEANIGTLRGSGDDKYVDYFYATTFKSGDDSYIFLTDTYTVNVQASQITSISTSLSGSTVAPEDTSTIQSGKVWYAAPSAIPEPTTGLLVLLGIAGLALRRRRV